MHRGSITGETRANHRLKMTGRDEADITKSSISRDRGADGVRRSMREALLSARSAIGDERRARDDEAICARLATVVAASSPRVVAAYWPVRGEPDLAALLRELAAAGHRLALPVVDAPAMPLRFVAWAPGDALIAGPWGIPRPASEETVVPDLLVIPCVGFDARCYRIGYGGGFYDRTLAALAAEGVRPRSVGVAYDAAQVDDIIPAHHDVALSIVVTPTRIFGQPFGK
jgi:5-formyltetrahydrofolate cyclo-ligase